MKQQKHYFLIMIKDNWIVKLSVDNVVRHGPNIALSLLTDFKQQEETSNLPVRKEFLFWLIWNLLAFLAVFENKKRFLRLNNKK